MPETEELSPETEETVEPAAAERTAERTEETEEVKAETEEKVAERTEEKAPDWREGISDEKARKFADQFNSPSEMAAAALGYRQKVSAAIVVPGKDATDEDKAAYRKATGVPETPEGYKITVPEDLPDHIKPEDVGDLGGFLGIAHEAGLSAKQVDAATDWYFNTLKAQEAKTEAGIKKETDKMVGAIKAEWGDEYTKNTEIAVRAAEEYGGKGFNDLLTNVVVDGVRLGDHPEFLRTFATIGRNMAEADPGRAGMSDGDRQSMTDEHRQLISEQNQALESNDRAKVASLESKINALSEKLGGRRQIVGDSGRTV